MMRGRTVVAVVLTAACLTFLLIFPIFGVRLHRDGAVAVLSLHLTPVLFTISAVIALYFLRAPARACWAVRPAIPITVPAHLIRPLRAIVLLAAVAFPFVASRGATDVMTLAWIYVLLGLGLNIAVGFAGLLVLGYAAFYAVGAYTYALLAQHWGLSFWWGLPIATLSAAAVGFLLGLPVLRLRGDYLAIVTLGFGEVIRLLLNNMNSLTGGPDGIGNIPRPTLLGLELTRKASAGGTTFHEWFGLPYRGEYAVIFLYLLGLALVLLILWVIRRLLYMPIGRAWEALREDETACRSLGLNPTAIKLSALTLSAACAGIAGAFFAARQGHINPESFTFLESAMVLAIVVLGGMGSQRGVVMAALLITILPEMARGFEAYRMLAFGLVMVLMMIVRPQGLWPAERPR